jgi:hypothetical protein
MSEKTVVFTEFLGSFPYNAAHVTSAQKAMGTADGFL